MSQPNEVLQLNPEFTGAQVDEPAPTGTSRYGDCYWCVKVPKSITPEGEIYFHADRVEVVNGALLAYCSRELSPTFTAAPGKWIICFAASVFDGHAVVVDRWKGEVIR